MEGDWLRDGRFDPLVCGIHLLTWLLIARAIAVQVGSVLRRGGLPLARSVACHLLRPGDLPGNGLDRIRRSIEVEH